MKPNLEDPRAVRFSSFAPQGVATAPTPPSRCGACPRRAYDCI